MRVPAREMVTQQYTVDATMRHVHRERLRVIPDYRSGIHRFQQPLRDQAFGKFALRIFIIEE